MPWAADFESAVSAYSTTSTNALQNCTGTAGTDGRLRAVRYIIIERRYIYARRCSNGRIDFKSIPENCCTSTCLIVFETDEYSTVC